MSEGCGNAATHALRMCVPDASYRAHHAWGFLGISLCRAHADEAEAWRFLDQNPAMIALMEATADGETVLDWEDAYISAVPLGSPEHQAWEAMERVLN